MTNIVILMVNYRSTHRSTANLTINFVQYTSMHTNITTYWNTWKKDLIREKKLGNSHLRNIPPRRPWIQAGIFADRENSRPEHGAACQEAARSLAKTAAGRKGPATNDKMTNELLKRQWKIKGEGGFCRVGGEHARKELFKAFGWLMAYLKRPFAVILCGLTSRWRLLLLLLHLKRIVLRLTRAFHGSCCPSGSR